MASLLRESVGGWVGGCGCGCVWVWVGVGVGVGVVEVEYCVILSAFKMFVLLYCDLCPFSNVPCWFP